MKNKQYKTSKDKIELIPNNGEQQKQQTKKFLELSKREEIEQQLKQYHTKKEREEYLEMVERYRKKVECEKRLAKEVEEWKEARKNNKGLTFMQYRELKRRK